MHQQEQIPITITKQLKQKWRQFHQTIQKNQPKIKGRFIFETLTYDAHIIDRQNRKNILHRIFTINSQDYQRSYLLYLPPKLKQNMQLIVLLHGTNETIFDTQLLAQSKYLDQQNIKEYGWLEIADKQSLVLLFPQSRGIIYKNIQYYGWQPGNQDILYLLKILQNITTTNYLQSKINRNQYINKQYSISKQNISIIGFSNGGLFTSQLYINYLIQQLHMNFSILIFINYMGGLNSELQSKQTLIWNKNRKNIPMVIFSCKKDQNYIPCLRAYQFLQYHQCNVCFVEIDHYKHQFISQMVQIIYQYIQAAKEDKIFQNSEKI